jgi:hypothetical protein
MSTMQIDVSPELKRAGRRFGYGVAVVINVVMLIVAQYIYDWGWLPFLTVEFAEVVPWISLSLMTSVLANLGYQFNDAAPVKSTGQILVNLISIVVSYRIFQIFPFDFAGHDFNWATVVRIVLILAMVGAGIGALTEVVKLASSGPRKERR